MAGPASSATDKALFLLPRLLLAALFFFANNLRAEDVLLTVNVKKPVALTSDKFLSYTLDPTVILTGNALTKNPEKSINMAKALAPAYVRIGGPRSNSYTFERPHRQQEEQDPGFTFTEGNWIVMHRWAENAGLDVLACIAPQHSESGGRDPGWDSRNALDLISFSDHMGFNTSWQLGYECQTRCDVSGIDIGRDVMRLRSMLDAFPRYSKSIITGPDVVTYRTKQQQQYLQDYLSVAGTALSAITWHPDFASITLDPEGVSLHHDNLALDRDSLYRVVGRLISKKPLWLAESKPEECKKQFLGALVWTRRLGNAAKLGVQVLMRQPLNSNLIQPTPDYWVSVLHKNLVGREVLDTKIATGNRTHVHFYCQCTKPSSKYEKGSLTIFGINLTPSKVTANLKGVKIKTLHKYILLPGFDSENRMFSQTVLLNNEPLNLLNDRELPEIKPTISSNSKGVALKLPSGGIGFWVIPGLKIKSCGGLEDDSVDKMLLKKLTKRLEESESDEDAVHEVEDEEEDVEEVVSAEERRFSPKTSKNKRRRKHRYSEEDDAERRYRKLEARMDLERLEKLLRRRDSHDDRKQPRGRTAYFGFEEKSQEKIYDDNDETGDEIRAKLEEYKNRLKEYESRKKVDSKLRGKVVESEMIDSEKVVEALSLISKMENAMKSLEKTDDYAPIETLNPSGSYDITSDLAGPIKSGNPEDMFLDELLKSEKIKRTSMPAKIEDQLRAIYQMLAEEKVRRQRNLEQISKLGEAQGTDSPLEKIDETLSRARRDTDKKFGEDPLGLRKEGLFRRRTKNDDAKERRFDRRRRKEKDDRKDGQAVIFDPRSAVDSNENNFYGFHQREPLKGFPEGDVFLTTGTSEEESGKDYDYVTDDDEGQEQEKPKKTLRSGGARNQPEPDDATWIEEDNTELSHVPKEFLEDVKMVAPRVQENLKEYGELWEAEALGAEQNPQDHFNPGDEDATVDKVVQERRPDAHEDKRAKETAVRKLIGYYEDPRSRQEEEEEAIDYVDTERLDKPRSPLISSPRSAAPLNERNQKPIQRNPSMTMNKKRIKDLGSTEFGAFTDYDSMHFGRAAISSAEHEALGIYKPGYPSGRPTSRAKRSIEDLEQIMNQEMIFQDDNNLKDCECRVIRGARASRRRGDRGERRRRLDRRYSEGKGRFRNREGPPTTKPGGRFDEDYMHSTRSKRQAVPSSKEMEEMIVGEQDDSTEDFSYESDASGEEVDSTQVSREASGGEEDISDEEDLIPVPTETIVAQVKLPANQDVQSLPTNKKKVTLALNENQLAEEQNDSTAKITGMTAANVELALEHETQDFEMDNTVKRHNEEIVGATLLQNSSSILEKSESPTGVVNVAEAGVKNPVAPAEGIEVSTVDSNAGQQFFLDSQPADLEANSTTVDQSSQKNLTRRDHGPPESPEYLQGSSSEHTRSAIGLRSVGAEAKGEDDSIATTAGTDQAIQETNGTTEQRNGEDPTAGTTNGATKLPLLEDPQALGLNNEAKEVGEVIAENRVKLEAKENTTEATTESKTSSSTAKKTIKLPRPTKETTRPSRRTSQKAKQAIKIVDPAKAREARVAARADALLALKKENDSKKAKKSLENATKMLTNEQAKFQAMQKKRSEQLEKLRDKLRQKRAKIVQEYRDELMGEINKASDGEEKHLKRREIIDMINNDDELRDIVDQEKLDYLMQNKPINYETLRDDNRTADSEQKKKYVPETVEIVRPLHEVRERKVKAKDQTIRHSYDPKILAYSALGKSTDSDAIKRALREGTDLTNHKVDRRAGKSYYSAVESLENPKIYHYQSEQVSEEGESGELFESAESGRTSSSLFGKKYSEEDIEPNSNEEIESEEERRHRKDYRRFRAISEPLEERQKGVRGLNYSPRLVRNASNGRKQYMCLKEDSAEVSIEDQDELFKLVKENDHYLATPVQDDEAKNKEKFASKKKYLKESDYEQMSKYKTPKYARLAPEKMEAGRCERLQNAPKKVEDYKAKMFDNEDLLQEVPSKNLRRKMKGGNAEDELYSIERKRDDVGQVKSDLEVIDDLDLDEALNSSKYELLMLIPVKSQKRNRQRRQVENHLFRDDENSVLNEISLDISKQRKNKSEQVIVEQISVTEMENGKDLIHTTLSQDLIDDEDAHETISEISTIVVVEKSNPSKQEDKKMHGRPAVKQLVRSVPQTISGKASIDDEGLPALIEVAIPRLEATVTGGLNKARHISESFEKFIDGFDDKFDHKQMEMDSKNLGSIGGKHLQNDSTISGNIFSATIASVKKFFDFLSGMIHTFRFD